MWWETHKFEDKDCEQERQSRLINRANQIAGSVCLLKDRQQFNLQVAKSSESGIAPANTGDPTKQEKESDAST